MAIIKNMDMLTEKLLNYKKINSGKWGKCHCQGMTMDKEKNYIYYSFTTKLVKTDLKGNVLGYVDNITGHLGCIDFNDEDGKVYASLEYKNDEIGREILRKLGYSDENVKDGFYIAIFDAEKINRNGMDAETDGVMKTAYLKTVYNDFTGTTKDGNKHIYGCSGIDGLAIGPDFGNDGNKKYLYVAYGIYGDVNRTDNDNQVILQYDITLLNNTAKIHKQSEMHTSGLVERNKLFLLTGNTTYGVQNLEYDEFTGDFIASVYVGQKKNFPNYTTFVIDGSIAPINVNGKKFLTLKKCGLIQDKISGFYQYLGGVEIGSMGMHSVGNGLFYIVNPQWEDGDNLYVYSELYRIDESKIDSLFEKVD